MNTPDKMRVALIRARAFVYHQIQTSNLGQQPSDARTVLYLIDDALGMNPVPPRNATDR